MGSSCFHRPPPPPTLGRRPAKKENSHGRSEPRSRQVVQSLPDGRPGPGGRSQSDERGRRAGTGRPGRPWPSARPSPTRAAGAVRAGEGQREEAGLTVLKVHKGLPADTAKASVTPFSPTLRDDLITLGFATRTNLLSLVTSRGPTTNAANALR